MLPRNRAKLAFVSAVALVLIGSLAATITVARLSNSAEWVVHTYQVQLAVSNIEFVLSEASRARLSYVSSGDETYLQSFDSANNQAAADLLNIRQLTIDNPRQQELCSQLEMLVNRRLRVLRAALELRKTGQIDDAKQALFTRDNVVVSQDIDNVMQQMEQEEARLLQQRMRRSRTLFAIFLFIVGAAFVTAVVFLWIHYRLLLEELGAREQAEASAHRLSARVLRLQDEERRRLSRELHDGLGQNLVAAKLALSNLANSKPDDSAVADCLKSIDESLAEARTISYLLHPPLLDDIGIASAAHWYLEGFSKRSGIEVSADIPDSASRMPRSIELALFRVLQESLTNIHRHAKSLRADVSLHMLKDRAVLRVRDYGKGIPRETLEHFLHDGTHVGVGLAGIRERVAEQDGEFEIYSDETGTVIEVTMPISAVENVDDRQGAPSPAN
jgi:signal transduction histidine kinase